MRSTLRSQLLDADDAELDAFLDACPASFAQQTSAWRDVITGIATDEPLFLGCRSEGRLLGVLPGYRFEGPLGAILTSVAQAGPLGGVACLPGVDPAPIYRSLLTAYADLASQRGCCLASVITNPFWPDHELYAGFDADFTLENSCLALDLERDVDEGGFPSAGSALGRQLRRAHSAGFAIDDEQSEANVSAWYAIHAARHAEIGATPLPEEMFQGAFRSAVPKGKARFFFVRDQGLMVGGGFYLLHNRVIDALMPAVRAEDARRGANYFLAEHTIRWARSRGLRYYNWQASPPGGGVYRFKRQWGSAAHDYYYLTRITGNADAILKSTPERIREAYPWHYVMPFDRIGVEASRAGGTSSRKAAWETLERGT